MATITLSGSNHFLLQKELHKLVADFVYKNGDLALEKIDGEEAEFERISEAIQSLPFLANKKMVVLRSPGAQKQFAEQIVELLRSIPDTTQVIIVEPKLDKRLVYYKVLKSQTDFREFIELDAPNLSKWLVQEALDTGGKLSIIDANYLVERVGASQQLLSNESEKLLNYNPSITKETIDLLTDPTPQSTIFELLDAAFGGNRKRVIELYKEQRALKVEPQQIMAMIAWQLHALALVVTAGDSTPDQIAKEARLNPYVVRKIMNIARKTDLKDVKRLISDALTLDMRMKSESIDIDEALQFYLLTINKAQTTS